MKSAKEITISGAFIALLIAMQWALSVLPNVELVSVFSAVFCWKFGVKRGAIALTAFSLLRCFVFGFYPTVVVSYFVYYTIFAVVFGILGNKTRKKAGAGTYFIVVLCMIAVTPLFTLIDCIVTPIAFEFSKEVWVSYFLASLPFMATQVLSAAISTAILFEPLRRAFSTVRL